MMNSMPVGLKKIPGVVEVPRGSNYVPRVNDWGLIDSTNFSMNLELKIGARVKLIHNINISDSLVNGDLGTVIDIVSASQSTNDVGAIIVAFDNPEAGLEQRRQYQHLADA